MRSSTRKSSRKEPGSRSGHGTAEGTCCPAVPDGGCHPAESWGVLRRPVQAAARIRAAVIRRIGRQSFAAPGAVSAAASSTTPPRGHSSADRPGLPDPHKTREHCGAGASSSAVPRSSTSSTAGRTSDNRCAVNSATGSCGTASSCPASVPASLIPAPPPWASTPSRREAEAEVSLFSVSGPPRLSGTAPRPCAADHAPPANLQPPGRSSQRLVRYGVTGCSDSKVMRRRVQR
jgi:hypothetical protein